MSPDPSAATRGKDARRHRQRCALTRCVGSSGVALAALAEEPLRLLRIDAGTTEPDLALLGV